MNSLIVIISALFLAAGLGYGRGAGTVRGNSQVIDAITKSWAGLAGLLLLFLLIAQFIAYFNYSKMPQVAAVKLGDLIEQVNLGSGWLLAIAILITLVVGIILPQAIAKWALLAPIFIPVFLRLGVEPEAVLAAYRVGDSPMNIVTPIMAYFPLIVVFAARYDKRSGIGTVIALMLPYFVALSVVWTAFFLALVPARHPLGAVSRGPSVVSRASVTAPGAAPAGEAARRGARARPPTVRCRCGPATRERAGVPGSPARRGLHR